MPVLGPGKVYSDLPSVRLGIGPLIQDANVWWVMCLAHKFAISRRDNHQRVGYFRRIHNLCSQGWTLLGNIATHEVVGATFSTAIMPEVCSMLLDAQLCWHNFAPVHVMWATKC